MPNACMARSNWSRFGSNLNVYCASRYSGYADQRLQFGWPCNGYQRPLRFGPRCLCPEKFFVPYSTFIPVHITPVIYSHSIFFSKLKSGLTRTVCVLEQTALPSCIALICAHSPGSTRGTDCLPDHHSFNNLFLFVVLSAFLSHFPLSYLGYILRHRQGYLQMYSAEPHEPPNLEFTHPLYDSLTAVILLETRLLENYIGRASLDHNGYGWQEGQGQRQE